MQKKVASKRPPYVRMANCDDGGGKTIENRHLAQTLACSSIDSP